ncbi:hypothetical protein SBDP2_1070013 [Syntrophobacter sp. SbD2]|nr:hypothetical protein SBDP2_1070013 [Syntrophobacter sp. SbD2]
MRFVFIPAQMIGIIERSLGLDAGITYITISVVAVLSLISLFVLSYHNRF